MDCTPGPIPAGSPATGRAPHYCRFGPGGGGSAGPNRNLL